MKHTLLKKLSMKSDPRINEKWVQEVIADNPMILNLGDVRVRDKERRQPTGGRIDLLLESNDGSTRYTVELQLGSTDETHIIRSIEYWDIERRRYPQYEHIGIIIAEDISSRFLNVVSLFNGFIPLMAIQVSAIELDKDNIGLHFTKVVDVLKLGEPDEDKNIEPADRAYWEKRASEKTVKISDEVLNLCKSFDSSLYLKYNKPYIGFVREGIAFNFATCTPQKSAMVLTIRLPQNIEIDEKLEQANIDLLEYLRWGAYRLKLSVGDIHKHETLLKEILKKAYEYRE